jgi:hypothetical protein
MVVMVAFGPYPKAAVFDGNLKQRFFGVYSYCEKIKAKQDQFNG